MYLDYFGLNRLPFSIAPDPDLLYLSPSHHEALAHLNYALTSHGGLICLTGEVGMGKTTLCRAFIDQAPEYVDIAYIFNPVLSATELLQAICQELEIPCVDSENHIVTSNKQLFDALYHGLIERYSLGKKVICIIDEAQSMPAPLLEQIRLLTNLETNKDKLLTLILVGQPELQSTLSNHGIRQLDQRITARFHINSMQSEELKPYIQHRLKQAGCAEDLFDSAALRYIWKSAKGTPRLINSIADRALLGAYATNNKHVSKHIAKQAVVEVLGHTQYNQPTKGFLGRMNVIGLVLVISTLVGLGLMTVKYGSTYFFDQTPEASLKNETVRKETLNEKPLETESLKAESPQKNHFELLSDANGLDSNIVDLTSCLSIEKNSVYRCLFLNWSLTDLKRLKRSIAVFDGEQWQIMRTEELMMPPINAVILWQPLAGFEGGLNPAIKPGQSHKLILWVREQLKSSDPDSNQEDWQIISPTGQSSLGFNEYYDPILANKVASFQSKSGLTPDRIIGLKTLLALQLTAREGL